MNHFSRPRADAAAGTPAWIIPARAGFFSMLLLAACGGPVSESAEHADETTWSAHYHATLDPDGQAADVVLEVNQGRHLLREMRFDPGQSIDVQGDGEITRTADELTWRPPQAGGRLAWRVSIPHRRGDGGYDAWLDSDWGLFRAEDIIPRAATRTLKGANATTRLSFDLPADWSVVTEYAETDGYYTVDKPGRRFTQPAGWIVTGELGVRRERIAGVRAAVAAPKSEQVRRLDMLALLNWTLPELARVIPDMPARLTIVSAGEPMWRGGLSAPQSIFMHADRPLISENGTSSLLHEVMHVAIELNAAPGHDWIVEGLAEFYSLELLRRSGTISPDRHESAMEQLERWSRSADGLCRRSSTGPTTALAVLLFRDLDEELQEATKGEATLDDLLHGISNLHEPVDADTIRGAFEELAGRESAELRAEDLPGCGTLAAGR